MQKLFSLVTALAAGLLINAQNIGIGTNAPVAKLHIDGSLLVNTPASKTNTAPTAAQQKTIVNAATTFFSSSDSTGSIYDPGGPAANYPANVAGFVVVPTALNCIGIEVTIETMQLNTGDSLIIKPSGISTDTLMAVGNGYTTTGVKIFNSGSLYIIFKSNADANTGVGFSLLFKRLYDSTASLPYVTGDVGKALLFDVKNGSLKSGFLSSAVHGLYSTALGRNTIASGDYSIATGSGTTANANGATAMGSGSTASGQNATALGGSTVASGFISVAMGNSTTASGDQATAMGYLTAAEAYSSTAMGFSTSAQGSYSTAMGNDTWAYGNSATALGNSTTAFGANSLAAGNTSAAEGLNSVALGSSVYAKGDNSFATGIGLRSLGFAGTTIGMYNHPVLAFPQTVVNSGTPLFIVGNGDGDVARSNAMIILKSGNTGIGTNAPEANLHIRHASGGGLMLENSSDNNKWRIYSASGDNNLTFYNNANAEVADIDDVTGAFNAVSDQRLKKNIAPMEAVMPLVMKLKPVNYQLNWQKSGEPQQIGLLAQEAYQLFPELVSYNKEKDLYKMNYAGFSTVALKAIQELQVLIQNQQKQIEELKTGLQKEQSEVREKLKKLETLICPPINL